ncbi:MAG: hypothetical protein KBF83_10005, partial [Pyrinomonadaceae bacterium]|nr:hypothetical protein [Pyrinomonadaceae bacterium]
PTAPIGQKLTVFIEPNVESVFPDAVAVYWDLETANRWSMKRHQVTKQDVKVLHYLALTKTARHSVLEKYFSKKVAQSLERLESAKLITRKPKSWHINPLKDIFAVKRLVTIEAKISDWQHGLCQAFFHTWFASESYLLVSKLPKNNHLVEQASAFGVGVISTAMSFEKSLAPVQKERIPKSYASWLFNEWVWKAHQSV